MKAVMSMLLTATIALSALATISWSGVGAKYSNPTPRTYFTLAASLDYFLDDKGSVDSAIASWTYSIERNPNDPRSYGKRGIAYVLRGATWGDSEDYTKGMEDLTQAIELNLEEDLWYAHYYRAVVYTIRKQHQNTLAEYTNSIEHAPNIELEPDLRWDLALTYNNRGTTYLKLRDVDRALADFAEAIKLDPKLAVAYVGQGQAHEIMGDKAAALTSYRETLRIEPDNKYAKDALERLGKTP
jgi:tetratricopeptide (TPR) repeat protein